MKQYKSELAAIAANNNPTSSRIQILTQFNSWLSARGVNRNTNSPIVFVGGSLAKNTDCSTSDIDTTIICSHPTCPASRKLIEASKDGLTLETRTVRIDARLIEKKNLSDQIRLFRLGQDVTVRLQDLLWNFQHGIYFSKVPTQMIEIVEACHCKNGTTATSRRILERIAVLVSTLRSPTINLKHDNLQIAEHKLRVMKLSWLLHYFDKGEGFFGYKNTNFIASSLSEELHLIICKCDGSTKESRVINDDLSEAIELLVNECAVRRLRCGHIH